MLPLFLAEERSVELSLETEMKGVRLMATRPFSGQVQVDIGFIGRFAGEGALVLRCRGRKTHLVCEGTARLSIDPADTVLMTVLGGEVSAHVLVPEPISRSMRYRVQFCPPLTEIWASTDHGVLRAGSVRMPFKVFYRPQHTRLVETEALVICREKTFKLRVVGQCGGFATLHSARSPRSARHVSAG